MTWAASVLTLFPEMFPGPLGLSLAGKAMERGRWSLKTVDIRSFATDAHRTVDDTPFGGGPGMVLKPDVVDAALRAETTPGPRIYLSPRGRVVDQRRIRELVEGPGVVLLCGRFEGLDQRVIDEHALEEISLGDFILSGGEPAAIAILDACVRLLPGTVGAPETLIEESFEAGLLEYPHYTRPQVWRERAVPDVLLSGNHGKIKAWRQAAAEAATKGRRPDLWDRYQTRKTARQSDDDLRSRLDNGTERATGRLAGALKEEVEK